MAHRSTIFKLNTGAQIPAVGFGTWQDAGSQEEAVTIAIKAGYRHIDTARYYGTEGPVGNAVKKAGIPRNQLFITSKLWNNMHHPDDVEKSVDDSLKDLGTDYIDLYLMHWPTAFERGDEPWPKDANDKTKLVDIDYVDTYRAMEKCMQKGKVRAIGVANFSRAELERLLKETSVVPAVHQMEVHPYLQQKSWVDFHKQKGIHVTQYSSLGNQNPFYAAGAGAEVGKLIEHPVIVEIAKKHGKSAPQVCLAWGIAHGRSVLSKSKTEARIKANLDADFALLQEDVAKIDELDLKLRFADLSEIFGYNYFADLDGK